MFSVEAAYAEKIFPPVKMGQRSVADALKKSSSWTLTLNLSAGICEASCVWPLPATFWAYSFALASAAAIAAMSVEEA